MEMLGFTAETSLYRTRGHYHTVAPVSSGLTIQGITLAATLCDWFPSLPGCSSQPPGVVCQHTNTDTSCTGVVEWCKDNSVCSDGSSRSSGWYVCGACFGWG